MIAIISGTNRTGSLTGHIAQLYRKLLEEKKVNTIVLDLAQLPHDFAFSALYENGGKNPNFVAFYQQAIEAEKLVFIIPEYNGSFPGVLKTFLDGMPYPNPWRNRKAALVGLSSGPQGGAPALSHFTDVLHYLGIHVLAHRVKMPFIEKNLNGNQLQNENYLRQLNNQINSLLAF
ncbi:MAG: NAD(P)H-dependent oxidoreductase [Cytophagales bacterium]|nr:NAD(P)H-dependent oxidoreductase [Bernardetiaceae bacterium]MDW8211395.1 NAD(P)H-dependent oxidoreductase [Cytophagales bacterium]